MAEKNSKKKAQLDVRRIRLQNVAKRMKDMLLKMWDFKNIVFFIGTVAMMHTLGDELAV